LGPPPPPGGGGVPEFMEHDTIATGQGVLKSCSAIAANMDDARGHGRPRGSGGARDVAWPFPECCTVSGEV
jgi:hypothetical protein